MSHKQTPLSREGLQVGLANDMKVFVESLVGDHLNSKSVWVGNVHPDTRGDPCIAATQNVLYS